MTSLEKLIDDLEGAPRVSTHAAERGCLDAAEKLGELRRLLVDIWNARQGHYWTPELDRRLATALT